MWQAKKLAPATADLHRRMMYSNQTMIGYKMTDQIGERHYNIDCMRPVMWSSTD